MPFPTYARFLLRRGKVQKSAQATATLSMSLPDSNVPSAQASKAASAMVIELTQALDETIERLDLEGEPRDELRYHLEQLSTEAAKYCNSQLDETTGVEWNCTREEAQLILAANCCASVIYDPTGIPSAPGLNFGPSRGYISVSVADTGKATGFWILNQQDGQGSLAPVLIISVRGTASVMDAMVNLNGERKVVTKLNDSTIPEHQAHSGFLNSAETLFSVVDVKTANLIQSSGAKHVLFTGHSAGGAVASLLFTRLLHKANPEDDIKYSLITFGAPPVTDIDITPHLLKRQQAFQRPGMVLAIANEFDTVTRADRPYMRSLVELHRSVAKCTDLTDTLNDGMSTNATRKTWPLPAPEYYPIGEVALLKLVIEESSEGDGGAEPVLKMYKISSAVLSGLVFCDIEVHRRVHYKKRVMMIAEGRFNGKEGWGITATTM